MREIAVARGASKRYLTDAGVVEALPPTDVGVRAGSVTALVGVSGSGKSTLLRLLAAHELPSDGTVLVDELDTRALHGRGLRELRRHVALVSQRAADNVFGHLTLGQQGARERELRVLGVPGVRDARPAQLSGGELARAAFAVALAQGATVLAVDEPTAELDRETAAAVLQAMRAAADAGAAIVVATHDAEVLAIADEVVHLARPELAAPESVLAPRGAEPALTARNLTKSYGATRAVRDASLTLHRGELAAVVGRSGSGKSTLLMLLAGWQPPDRGTVDAHRAWSELAYVPQRFGLVPELSVAENVELPARLARTTGRTAELLERLDLAHLDTRYPHQISIGQQQRVAVARAVSVDSQVVLVDEPTSHQDATSAERVWSVLHEAAADGAAIIVATHEPNVRARVHTAWEIVDGVLRALE